jgi:hypothetical protein
MVFEAARWKLEKGATLGLLEQLIGSRTVGSTLTTQINLGKFNILGFVLLVLWAFSPLGSQSVLRMLGTRLEPMYETSKVFYFDTDAHSQLASDLPWSPESSANAATQSSFIRTMYTSLFLASASSKKSPMDIWGNVRIPNLDINDDDWHYVPSSPAPDSYSAFVGLPITNVTTGNATFFLESSYLHLECSKLTRAERDSDIITYYNWSEPNSQPKPNGTWHGRNRTELQMPWAMAVDRFVDPYWSNKGNLSSRYNGSWFVGIDMIGRPIVFENETNLDAKPSNLLFESGFAFRQHSYAMGIKTECQVLQRYVESQVHCLRLDLSTPQNCSVTAQRLSRKKHSPEDITMLSWEVVWSRVSSLPVILGGSREYPDIVMRYINNPHIDEVPSTATEEDKNMFKSVSPEQFGRRLAQVINTYLLVGQVYQSAMKADANFVSNVTVPIQVGNLVEVYTVHWSWMALFILSCAILLASGIVSAAFAHLAIGPEILGYASSAVRDSRYIDLPPELGKKEALDVTKMIGQKRLKYGFINSAAEDGRQLVGIGLESQIEGIHKHSTSTLS